LTNDELRCTRCASVIAVDDLRCPVCNLTCPVPTAESRAETAVEILRCTGCGAAMTYEVAKRAAACAFCGSVLSIEHPHDPIEEAERSLPFTVDRERSAAAFRQWLGTLGCFRPGDLTSTATLETIQPLRWVAWVFDARATVSWAADTDAGAQRSDWAPHAGLTELDYDDVVVPATRGLRPDEVAHLLPSYDLAGDEVHDVVDDATTERFDVPRSTARARLVDAVERLARTRLAERHLPGRRWRNLQTSTVLRGLDARRVALPAWVLAYRYKDTLFRTVLSGQDATRLTGDAPYSTLKIAAAITAGLVAGTLLLALWLV
jgi:hypothetical protein